MMTYFTEPQYLLHGDRADLSRDASRELMLSDEEYAEYLEFVNYSTSAEMLLPAAAINGDDDDDDDLPF